jgi:hypothetical protein
MDWPSSGQVLGASTLQISHVISKPARSGIHLTFRID